MRAKHPLPKQLIRWVTGAPPSRRWEGKPTVPTSRVGASVLLAPQRSASPELPGRGKLMALCLTPSRPFVGKGRIEAIFLGQLPLESMIAVAQALRLRHHCGMARRDAQGVISDRNVRSALPRQRLNLGFGDVGKPHATTLPLGVIVHGNALDTQHLAD